MLFHFIWWLLRFIASGWVLHSQQILRTSSHQSGQSSQFSSCFLDQRRWSPESLGSRGCEPVCAPLADSWGAETSTTSGCLVQRRAPESCSTRRYVLWHSEGWNRSREVRFLVLLRTGSVFVIKRHSPFEEVKVVQFNGTTKRIVRILNLLFVHIIVSWKRRHTTRQTTVT